MNQHSIVDGRMIYESTTVTTHLIMILRCVYLILLLYLQDGLTNAHYKSEWISSSNLSPFYRLLSNTSGLEEMCPLVLSDHCVAPSRSSLSVGTSNTNNVSITVENALPDIEDAIPFSASKRVFREENLVISERAEKQPITESSRSEEQPPIATFDEWTKEKLKQEGHRKSHLQSQQQSGGGRLLNAVNGADTGANVKAASEGNVPSVPSVPSSVIIPQQAAQRNYASRECGAKVLFSNTEAENKNAVLNEKERDDYMRNPCERAQHKWLIIELCETVLPKAIELANFELFSSGPQKVRVSASERYPSNDWITLEEFVAEDSRNVQRFPITTDINLYVKFIRVELLTHYGNEHYCTLSMIRVLGISMVDEYEAEAEAAASVSAVTPPTVDSVAKSSSDLEKQSEVEVKTEVNVSEIKPTLHQVNDSKTKEVPLVNAVVNAVGNIAIKNIKDAFESAFLGKWKSGESPYSRKTTTIPMACSSCPAADSFTIPVLFCRAFFPQLVSEFSKQGVTVDSSHVKERVDQSDPQSDKAENKVMKDIDNRKDMKQKRDLKRSNVKRFLKRVMPRIICLPGEHSNEEMLVEPRSNAKISDNDRVTDISSKSCSSIEETCVHLQHQQPTATILPTRSTNLGHQTLPGVSMSHKESVFLKLNKRINALELNMSLSSEYLSELSRRYVEQTNDSRRHAEKVVRFAEEAAQNAARAAQQKLAKQVEGMGRELKELSRMVRSLWSRSAAVESSLKMASVEQQQRQPEVENDRRTVKTHSQNEEESVLLHPREHLLYSNDYVWTTEQLVYMVVAAQACTAVLMLLVQCFYDRRRRMTEQLSIQDIVEERVTALVRPLLETQNDESKKGVNAEKSRRSRHRKNNVQLKNNSCEQEDNWDSAVESSARSVTPTRSDLSSELEVEGRLNVAMNLVDDCAAVLSQLDWAKATAMERGSSGKLKQHEHEETPEFPDKEASSHFNQDSSLKGVKVAAVGADETLLDEVNSVLTAEAIKTPTRPIVQSSPPPSGRSWHLVKPSRRRNKKQQKLYE
uniref:SUN domain-containing protein n=1 Tax=Parascaris univalens TaxID=6257 RepID=A0A915BH74_PARUN